MLEKAKHTVGEFTKMGGGYILSSSILSKILSFLVSLVAIRLLLPETYGQIVFATSVIQFILPFMGGGAHIGVLRYGPLMETHEERQSLFNKSLSIGLLISLGLWVFTVILAMSGVFNEQNSTLFICLLGLQVIIHYPFELFKSHQRVQIQNKAFSAMDLIHQGLALALLFTIPYLGGYGYILALLCAPLVAVAFASQNQKKHGGWKAKPIEWPQKFWSYSLKTSMNNTASFMVYVLDFFLIGVLLNDSVQLAGYRAASLIPNSLNFVPIAFITTHYVHLSKNYLNRSYLDTFIKKYFALFIPIGIAVSTGLWLFSGWILPFFFGAEYVAFSRILQILSLGVMGIFCLRIPFGNLLAGVGQASQNLTISLITLALNLILNLILIPKFGIAGAAWATVISLWFSGFVALLFFVKYLNSLTHDTRQNHQ